MGFAQWVVIYNINKSDKTVLIKNVKIHSGKFHKDDDKDSEVAASEIEGQELPPDTTYRINSCGKELNSTDGTEGEYDLVETDTGELIRHVYWNNPWDNSQPNTFTNTGGGLDWLVQVEGGNHEGGELGEIRLTLFRL